MEELEKRLKKLETIASRVSRRIPRDIRVASVPYPVSMHCVEAIDGIAGRYMFPADGVLTKACILIVDSPAVVKASAALTTLKGESFSWTFDVQKRGSLMNLDRTVTAGDRLELFVPEGTKNIWMAFLWSPSIADHVLKKFAIEELEAVNMSPE